MDNCARISEKCTMPELWGSPTFQDWMTYSREVNVNDRFDMDKSKFISTDELSYATRTGFPEDSLPIVKDEVESSGHTPEDSQAVENVPDSGDGGNSVVPFRKKPKKFRIQKNRFSAMLILFFCLPSVTGPSPQMELPIEAQKDKNQTRCQEHQYDLECLQRPPAEVFRNMCADTCFVSKTPSFQMSPKNKTIKEGLNVSLECSTNYKVELIWYKNDVPIGRDERVSVNNSSNASVLTIIGANTSDNGEYHCGANNGFYGPMSSSKGMLSIKKAQETANNTGVIIAVLLPILMTGVVVVVCLVRKRSNR